MDSEPVRSRVPPWTWWLNPCCLATSWLKTHQVRSAQRRRLVKSARHWYQQFAVVLAALLPYARTSEGLGRPLTHAGRLRSIAAVVIGLGVAVALRVSIGTWASLMVLALTMVMAWFYRRWLGGFTGDLLGAASEVNEVAVLLLGVAMLGHV